MAAPRDAAGALDAVPPLRVITCGSVDDGKSTLIGRLLHDAGALPEDQAAALARDSARHGTVPAGADGTPALDFALLLDGLEAEREQGITIDVSWRYFSSARRAFILADCPGHVQYTRNMATGASNADIAIVLVDARKGVLPQTRRHSWICALMGIREVVLAVNKMDLVGWDEAVFARIRDDYAALAAAVGLERVHALPVSALAGDQVVARGPGAPWYAGPALLPLLETLAPPARGRARGFRLPVQWVNRPHQDFRGFCGTLEGGPVAPGDAVVVLPAGRSTRIARVLGPDGELARGEPGMALTLVLADEVDASRGDVLAAASDPPEVADQVHARLLWMGEAPMLPGRPYWLRLGTASVGAQVMSLRHRIDLDTQEPLAARRLQLNEVGVVTLGLDRELALGPFADEPGLGAFVLVDRASNATVAAGTLDYVLRRSRHLHPQALAVDRAARAAAKGQRARVLWFTGLSGSGKSTLANALDRRLHAAGFHTAMLDGDNVRHGLNRDLGFTDADRVENIRRVAEVARLMADAGLIVLVSFISPFRAERAMARARSAEGEFVEVYVDTPLAECERRDPKGLYAKARAGEIANFTGLDSPYEPPEAPELVVRTAEEPLEASVERLFLAATGE